MIHQTIPIVPKKSTVATAATLTTYIMDSADGAATPSKRPAVVVCPGGGYEFTSDREAEPIALAFNARGYHAFVLRYNVAPARYPQALLELAMSVALVRSRAEEWNVESERILVCGFSAGGHLAASLATLWNDSMVTNLLGFCNGEHRPDGAILSYPVITSGEYAHRGSFEALTGGDTALQEWLSLEQRVTPNTPPCFLWHTADDAAVPVENTLLFAAALRKQRIPMEVHVYSSGVHGLSLASELTGNSMELIRPEIQPWVDMAARWGKDITDVPRT